MKRHKQRIAARIRATAPVHLLRDAGCADELALRWSERQRVWHGPGHLLELLAHFEKEADVEARETLLLAAVYHNAVYDPTRADNEEASAALLLAHATEAGHPVVRRAADIIVASKWSEVPGDALTRKFWEADCRPLAADYPQAERVFDKVIVGVAVNRQKPGAATTLTERRAELQARLRFHEVVEVPGLLTDFIASHPLPLSVVRGVRDGTDLEAELRFARFLDELRPGTNVVWIGCEAELQHLSSSAIRELDAIEPSSGARYVPETAEIYCQRSYSIDPLLRSACCLT